MSQLQPYAVMVPYYSNIAYLREALESVVRQTDEHWWCVVVDDSPTGDGVADLVADLVAELHEPRIEYVRNPVTLGVAGNFNRCFELAWFRGADLAVVLHADDLLEPGYVAAMRRAHRWSPAAACVAPKVTVIDVDGSPHRPLPDRVKTLMWPRRLDRLEGDVGLAMLLRGQFFYCPAVSYRLALLEHPAWDERWCQVMDLMLYGRLLLRDQTIALHAEPVYRYRRHAASVTQLNSASRVRTLEEIDAARELAEAARRRGWRSAARAGRWRVSTRLQSLTQVPSLVAHGRFGDARTACSFAARR